MSLCPKLPEVPVLCVLIASICDTLRSRAAPQIEILAPRHQLGVQVKRPRLTKTDRVFWAWLSQAWADWRSAIAIVKPETGAWQRRSFRLFWTWEGGRSTTANLAGRQHPKRYATSFAHQPLESTVGRSAD